MANRVDLFNSTYGHFTDRVLDLIRKETFGVDVGQNSWLTADEYERFISWLDLGAGHHALEVASGSGGPALHLAQTTGCRVTGIDSNELGVSAASQMAAECGCDGNVRFRVADVNAGLPFGDGTFDALLCIDSFNHFPDRLAVLREWHRVLRPGRRAIFTDPVVVTGPVTDSELALRSSIGHFLFVPPGINERLIEESGLALVRQDDVTGNAALVAGRWLRSRHRHRDELVTIEGLERFEGLQRFFEAVHRLASERRLSRFAYLVEKPAVPSMSRNRDASASQQNQNSSSQMRRASRSAAVGVSYRFGYDPVAGFAPGRSGASVGSVLAESPRPCVGAAATAQPAGEPAGAAHR